MNDTVTAQTPTENPLDRNEIGAEELIKDLLGFDCASLSSMDELRVSVNLKALRGLKAFMRRVLQLAIQLQEDPKLVIRLKSEKTAIAHGWPNARIANTGMLFVWSMIRDERWIKGQPFARLEASKGINFDPPVKITRTLRSMSDEELVAAYTEIPTARLPKNGTKLPEETFPLAVSTIVRADLGLEPATLTRGYRESEAQIEALFAGKLETRTLVGIRCLVSRALSQYRVMRTRGTTRIRLMSDADAEEAEWPSARAAHLSILLAAALHADDRHEIVFELPRMRRAEDNAMLRETAKSVYLHYSDESMAGLELIVDGNTHFGWPNFTLAERLLGSVARDVDPNLEAMPHTVAMQKWSDDVLDRLEKDDPALGPLQQRPMVAMP